MIGLLRGQVVSKDMPFVMLDVHGVGYEIETTLHAFYGLPGDGGACTLLTHLVVREDAQLLYGFANKAEKRLFRDLIKVSGVGAKLALAILSGTTVEEFVIAVRQKDSAVLTKLPGVGKKTAERLIVEMFDRLKDKPNDSYIVPSLSSSAAVSDPGREASEALMALGYKSQEVSHMLNTIDSAHLTSDEIIRLALRQKINEPATTR